MMGKRIGIFIFLSFLLILVYFAFVSRPTSKTIPEYLSTFVPDKYIKNVNLLNWQNSFLYIQFVSLSNLDSVRLLRTVIDNWASSNLKIIALINDEDKEKTLRALPSVKYVYVINRASSLEATLSSTGAYFIYGKQKRFIQAGTSNQRYDDYVKIYLLRLIKNDRFQIADFIPKDRYIYELPHLASLSERISHSDKRYFLVALFNDFCSSCKAGTLIQYLNTIKENDDKSFIDVLALLNSEYNTALDKEALISQSRVSFPVYLSDPDLSRLWVALITRYNRPLLGDILIIINKAGRIESVLDYSCDCDASFYEYVNDLR